MDSNDALVVFKGAKIRRIWQYEQWYFSVVAVIQAITNSGRPRKYWSDLSEKIGQLKLQSADGKFYATDCANTETMFRIIQSIPSPRVEPLKRWLARVGKERIDEIENPELAMARMQELYEKKGYPKEWIDKRLRGIAVRQQRVDRQASARHRSPAGSDRRMEEPWLQYLP